MNTIARGVCAASFLFAMIQAAAAPACPLGITIDGKSCKPTADSKPSESGGGFDVLGNIMDTTKKEINAQQAVAASKEEFFKSDFHKKQTDGYWEYFQANSNAKPGEYCTAMFMRQGMAVALLGPGGDYKGALMMFLPLTENAAFPQTDQPRVIKVSLKQANDPLATVSVFNLPIGHWKGPAIAFAVPTIEAALEGMTDTLDFHLQYEGKNIGDIEWHSGLAARDALRKCLSAG